MYNDVTFIIVTWNNEKEIENCIRTIFRYSPSGSKITIIDNCSTDSTVSIIKSKFKNVNIIQSDHNLGFAGANNIALNTVNTEYVCFINPDVILTEDIISPAIEILGRSINVGLVASRLKNLDGTDQQSYFSFASPWNMFAEILHIGKIFPNFLRKKYFLNYYYAQNDFFPDWVIGAEMVLRTKEAKEIGGFSQDYFMYTEDMDFCKKISQKLDKKIYFHAYSSLIHIGGASEVQNINYTKQFKLFENVKIFVEKFDGELKAIKTIKAMLVAYILRLSVLQFFYFKKDRELQIDRTKQAISMLRKLL